MAKHMGPLSYGLKKRGSFVDCLPIHLFYWRTPPLGSSVRVQLDFILIEYTGKRLSENGKLSATNMAKLKWNAAPEPFALSHKQILAPAQEASDIPLDQKSRTEVLGQSLPLGPLGASLRVLSEI